MAHSRTWRTVGEIAVAPKNKLWCCQFPDGKTRTRQPTSSTIPTAGLFQKRHKVAESAEDKFARACDCINFAEERRPERLLRGPLSIIFRRLCCYRCRPTCAALTRKSAKPRFGTTLGRRRPSETGEAMHLLRPLGRFLFQLLPFSHGC